MSFSACVEASDDLKVALARGQGPNSVVRQCGNMARSVIKCNMRVQRFLLHRQDKVDQLSGSMTVTEVIG